MSLLFVHGTYLLLVVCGSSSDCLHSVVQTDQVAPVKDTLFSGRGKRVGKMEETCNASKAFAWM